MLTTDSSGRFAFEDLDPVDFRLTARRSGYEAVTRTVRPAITGIQVTGTLVEITFAAGSVDQAADFVVARAAEATGPYTNATATITATGAGTFKAVVPVNGNQGFFQVLRVPLAF